MRTFPPFPRRYLRPHYTRSRPRIFILILLFITLFDAFLILNSSPPLLPQANTLLSPSSSLDDQPPRQEKIFIASLCRNTEYILRSNWSSAVLSLATALGPENVYVSILESGSQDGTKSALTDLQFSLDELGVKNTMVMEIDAWEQAETLLHVPEEGDREGWIETGRGESGWEKRRIPHLAELRNRVLEPMFWGVQGAGSMGGRWDKVVWINDVVFTPEDVLTLLATNSGSYAAACALDFSVPNQYYDTFALRDLLGQKTASLHYPYFLPSSPSLPPLRSSLPAPVKSCWNGMVVFDSAPFYDDGLRFRGTEDSLAKEHLEGSECCFIHSDNGMREEKGVWLNPNVRVAYKPDVYEVVGWGKGGWPGRWEMLKGTWTGRWVQWVGGIGRWSEDRVTGRRVEKWIREGRAIGEEREEVGRECLINEMQVLFENGWKHV